MCAWWCSSHFSCLPTSANVVGRVPVGMYRGPSLRWVCICQVDNYHCLIWHLENCTWALVICSPLTVLKKHAQCAAWTSLWLFQFPVFHHLTMWFGIFLLPYPKVVTRLIHLLGEKILGSLQQGSATGESQLFPAQWRPHPSPGSGRGKKQRSRGRPLEHCGILCCSSD